MLWYEICVETSQEFIALKICVCIVVVNLHTRKSVCVWSAHTNCLVSWSYTHTILRASVCVCVCVCVCVWVCMCEWARCNSLQTLTHMFTRSFFFSLPHSLSLSLSLILSFLFRSGFSSVTFTLSHTSTIMFSNQEIRKYKTYTL